MGLLLPSEDRQDRMWDPEDCLGRLLVLPRPLGMVDGKPHQNQKKNGGVTRALSVGMYIGTVTVKKHTSFPK